jgi:hypothetical protein
MDNKSKFVLLFLDVNQSDENIGFTIKLTFFIVMFLGIELSQLLFFINFLKKSYYNTLASSINRIMTLAMLKHKFNSIKSSNNHVNIIVCI